MSTADDAGPLTRLGNSTLYALGGGETWVFLLWDATGPPASIPLDDTWSDRGAPRRPGWYVFVTAAPDQRRAATLERALRDALSSPKATGLVWAAEAGAGVDLLGTVVVTAEAGQRPVVAADTVITLPPGVLGLGFERGMSLVLGHAGSGLPARVIATRPAYEDQPWTGIAVPLTGQLAGCLTFTALLESTVKGDQTTKLAADVRVDPLRPFDPRRTRTTPTGAAYLLIAEAHDAYRLVPVAADRPREGE